MSNPAPSKRSSVSTDPIEEMVKKTKFDLSKVLSTLPNPISFSSDTQVSFENLSYGHYRQKPSIQPTAPTSYPPVTTDDIMNLNQHFVVKVDKDGNVSLKPPDSSIVKTPLSTFTKTFNLFKVSNFMLNTYTFEELETIADYFQIMVNQGVQPLFVAEFFNYYKSLQALVYKEIKLQKDKTAKILSPVTQHPNHCIDCQAEIPKGKVTGNLKTEVLFCQKHQADIALRLTLIKKCLSDAKYDYETQFKKWKDHVAEYTGFDAKFGKVLKECKKFKTITEFKKMDADELAGYRFMKLLSTFLECFPDLILNPTTFTCCYNGNKVLNVDMYFGDVDKTGAKKKLSWDEKFKFSEKFYWEGSSGIFTNSPTRKSSFGTTKLPEVSVFHGAALPDYFIAMILDGIGLSGMTATTVHSSTAVTIFKANPYDD